MKTKNQVGLMYTALSLVFVVASAIPPDTSRPARVLSAVLLIWSGMAWLAAIQKFSESEKGTDTP